MATAILSKGLVDPDVAKFSSFTVSSSFPFLFGGIFGLGKRMLLGGAFLPCQRLGPTVSIYGSEATIIIKCAFI